jgi:hypothetical protein
MDNCTPIAFLPTRENVNGKNIYRDLSNYSCNAKEKRFLAEEILDIHNLLELSNTNIKTGFGKNTCRGMCERYNLSRNKGVVLLSNLLYKQNIIIFLFL